MNAALGVWVNHQRTQYKLYAAGKPSYLTPERVQKLEGLKFEWSAVDAKWMARFVELARHVRKHGIGTIPSKRSNMGLWQWAKYQRRLYHQLKAGADASTVAMAGQSLTKTRQELLDLLGFPWEERHSWKELNQKQNEASLSLVALKQGEGAHRHDSDDVESIDDSSETSL